MEDTGRIRELEEANADLDNLLAGAGIGALYIDADLRIRRVTPILCQDTHLTPDDVGMSVDSVTLVDDYPEFAADVRRCSELGEHIQKELLHDGVVCMFRMRPYYTSDGEQAGVVVVLFDVTAPRREKAELLERSNTDSMTRLLNHEAVRTQVRERLNRLREGQTAYLMICDVDNFKLINDMNGHLFGDVVLCAFADELRTQFPDELKGRIGGDEFLLYTDAIDRDELERRLGLLTHFVSDCYVTDGQVQQISSSIGAAEIHAGQTDYDVIFQWADSALYNVKKNGKGGHCILNVPSSMELPEHSYLATLDNGEEYRHREILVRSEEELILFCMELLENVPDLLNALRMISERLCRFYELDDLVFVEHGSQENSMVYRWSRMNVQAVIPNHTGGLQTFNWDDYAPKCDEDGALVLEDRNLDWQRIEEIHTALLVCSRSVRDYHASIVFRDSKPGRLWTGARDTLVRISNLIFYRMRNRKHEEERLKALDRAKNYDALTGFPFYNRWVDLVREYLHEHTRENLYCVATDFSNFQYFNEKYGYETGDKLLKEYADWLRGKYGEECLFGRISSDHFVGLLQGDSLKEVSDDYFYITRNFDTLVNARFHGVNLTLATGICPLRGMESDIVTVFDNANEARKKGKEQKVRTYVKVYTEKLRKQVESDKEVRGNIVQGWEQKEFTAWLQPKVDLRSGKVVGAEALARWMRPGGVCVMPGDFVGVAEQSGMITKIDFKIFDQVLDYLGEALDDGEETVPISVNFSRRQNEFEEFIPSVAQRLKKSGIPPYLLEAEITESVFMSDLTPVTENVRSLRGMGLEVSVDDFGSGYSSLNMLSKVEVDTIKLDREFIVNAEKDEKGLVVLRYLIKMLKHLGFKVLAEGAETEAQIRWLRDADCDIVQGFYYAKPMPIPEFRAFLKEFNGR